MRISDLCKLAIENELLTAQYDVVAASRDADAVLSVALTYSHLGRGFLGLMDASAEISLSYTVQLRAVGSGKLFLGFTDDAEDTPAGACGTLAKKMVKKLARARAQSVTP